MVGGGIDTDTPCIIIKNIEGNLKLSLQETQLPALSGPSTGLWNSEQTRNDQLTTLELRRGFLRLQGSVAEPDRDVLKLPIHSTGLCRKSDQISKKKKIQNAIHSLRTGTLKNTRIVGPKPPCYSSFQKSATRFYIERLATRRNSATRDSGDSGTRPTLDPGVLVAARGPVRTFIGAGRCDGRLAARLGCRTGRLAGTAGLKRHIRITMELPLELSRLSLTSLLMPQKAWP